MNEETKAEFAAVAGAAGYHYGVQEERARIIAYLLEMNVLRDAMFYKGYVAMDVDGNSGVDLTEELGGN